MIFRNAYDVVLDDVFIELEGFAAGIEVILKLEGLNPVGSIKLKTANALIEVAENAGRLGPGSRIIESTSGNLGSALAQICAAKDYPLTLVTDPNANERSIRMMRCFGAEVVRVENRDAADGFLQSRIDYVHERLAEDERLVWLNQYANPANARIHREQTAKSMHKELGELDGLFVGAGTTGTLMGCVDYFRIHSPGTRVVAVDALGSVTFGLPPGPRRLSGLGASRRPELFEDRPGLEKEMVSEPATVAMCHRVARRYGLMLGPSTGTVLTAVERLAATFRPGARVGVISPDLGEKYLDTVYSAEWLAGTYPDDFGLSAAPPPPSAHNGDDRRAGEPGR